MVQTVLVPVAGLVGLQDFVGAVAGARKTASPLNGNGWPLWPGWVMVTSSSDGGWGGTEPDGA